MCLGVPGRVDASEATGVMTMGSVSFGGVTREICLAYVPEVAVGDYVLAQLGFAVRIIEAQEAAAVLALLRELQALDGPPG